MSTRVKKNNKWTFRAGPDILDITYHAAENARVAAIGMIWRPKKARVQVLVCTGLRPAPERQVSIRPGVMRVVIIVERGGQGVQ